LCERYEFYKSGVIDRRSDRRWERRWGLW